MKKISTIGCFFLAFIYSALAALVLQKLVLPMMPALHGGSGLLQQDATIFHQTAIQLAETIQREGWGAWRLYPAAGMTGNVGLLGALYALFGVEPALFIPFAAAAHALAAAVLYAMGPKLWPGRVGQLGGTVAAIFFVSFPSALQWYGQNHKDTFAIAGTLLIAYSLISIDEETLTQKRAWLKGVLLCLGGVTLIVAVRPYFLMIVLLGLAAASCLWCLLTWFNARRQILRGAGYCLALLIVVVTAVIVAPSDRDLINGNQVKPSDISHNITSDLVRNWVWRTSDALPTKLDTMLERVSNLRVVFIQYGIEMRAGSQIDSDRAPASALEVLAYLPRATVIGLFAPFPSTWAERQTLPRLIGAVETSIFYLVLVGLLGLLNPAAASRNILTGLTFALTLIAVLAYVHPNVGTLYRQRYGLWFIFIACGCVGWVGLAQRVWQAIRPHGQTEGVGVSLKGLPQLALSGAAIVLITATSYLGFVIRDLILVKDYGINGHLDSFFMAAMLPMFGVTALSLPLSDAMTARFMMLEETDAQRRFAGGLLSVLSVILGTMALLLLVFAEPVIRLVGGLSSPEAVTEAALMLRLFLPILAFAGWTAIGNAVLNARHRPRVVAFGQAVVPLITVLVLLTYGASLGVKAAIYGMLLGFALNVLILGVAMSQAGLALWPVMPEWRELAPTLRKYGRLSCVALVTAASVPLNYYFAATLEQGSVTTWALGSKMIQLVTGLAAITIGSIFLPHFSQLHRHRDQGRIGRDMYFLLLSCTWLSLLLALLIQIFADPLVLAVFQSSDISVEAALHLAAILRLGSLQLPFIIVSTLIIKFLAVSGLGRRAVLASMSGLALNFGLNLLLVEHYGVLGLTMAMVIAAAAPAVYLVTMVRVECGISNQQMFSLFAVWGGLGILTMTINFSNVLLEFLMVVFLLGVAYVQWRQLSQAKALSAIRPDK